MANAYWIYIYEIAREEHKEEKKRTKHQQSEICQK